MALTPRQQKAALEKGLSINLIPDDDSKYRSPNPSAAAKLLAKPSEAAESTNSLPADGRPVEVPADRLSQQTVNRQYYRQTGSKHYRQTGSKKEHPKPIQLPADGRPVVEEKREIFPLIPLAPIQWAVWEVLREAESSGKLVSYRKLSQAVNASIRGVRDALSVIENEGGIRSKSTVRLPDEQGMRIELNTLRQFRLASLSETKGIIKRGNDYRQTVDRQSSVLPADGLRLSVCITDYIKQTDIAEFLKILPPLWNIRERTLIEIARSFPAMTTLEFRRSLLLLTAQTQKSQTIIQNHNAWLKAAFAKNEGPLVTQRMIEAHLDQLAQVPKSAPTQSGQKDADDNIREDFDTLRRYLAASVATRMAIDQVAEGKLVSALRVTPSDKHSEVREQALIEATREFFAKNSQVGKLPIPPALA